MHLILRQDAAATLGVIFLSEDHCDAGSLISMRSEFPEPIRILSDLHLGHPGSRIGSAEQLRPLLEGAGTVIFNGDTRELRAANYREVTNALYEDLLKILEELRIEAIFLSGNHDPTIGELHHLDLCDEAVLVTHGDVLFPEIAPWSIKSTADLERILAFDRQIMEEEGDAFEARLRRAKQVTEFTSIFDVEVERGALGQFHTLINVLFPPSRPLVILRVWGRQKHLAASFCEKYRPRARFMMFGHTHFSGVWNVNGRIIVNTGGYVSPGGALLAEIGGGELRVYRVKSERGVFVTAAEPGWRFAVGREVVQPARP